MSMGLNALRGVIDAGSVTLFRSLKAEWFTEDEADYFDYVRKHVKRYSRLPDIKTLNDNGYKLPGIKQPAQYYIDKLADRAVYNAVNEKHAGLVAAMRNKDVDAIKGALREMIQGTRIVERRDDYSTLAEQAEIVREEYKAAKRSPGLQGITLGYQPLDDITNGAQGGDVIVIAGRPNKGKSYKLLSMLRAAHLGGYAPAVCSMEMTSKQLSTRYLGMLSGVNPDFIRRGELSTAGGERVFYATLAGLAQMPPLHFMEGNFRKSVSDVDQLVQQFSPDILYIDAGYLLTPELQNKNFSKADYIGRVMEEIKAMAHDRNVPVVMSVQLNREAARAGKKGLDLSFLAGTDVIAQAATVVIGMTDGKPPYEDITREYQVIKNREGKLLTYQGNFNFSPMNFGYIEGSEAAGSGDTEEPDTARDEAVQEEARQLAEAGWER